MRSIFRMPSDNLAGGALRRVPIPERRMTALLACLWLGVLNSYDIFIIISQKGVNFK